MNDAALRSPITALSEPRLSALDDLWVEMGRFHNSGNTAGAGAICALPWPTLPPPRPTDVLGPLEPVKEATLG